MNKLFYCSILITSAILILNPSCKKERKPTEYHVEQYLKDWMFFDTGTWWTYKEINSGTIDSQYVIKSELIQITSENKKKSPYYTVEIGMVYTNSNYYFQLSSPKGGSVIEKILTLGSERGSTYLLYNPLKIGDRKGSSGLGYTEITQINPHFILNNIKYDSLITYFDNYDLSENNDSVEYKILKGVGIINKKNISKKEEWQLVNYHINLNKK